MSEPVSSDSNGSPGCKMISFLVFPDSKLCANYPGFSSAYLCAQGFLLSTINYLQHYLFNLLFTLSKVRVAWHSLNEVTVQAPPLTSADSGGWSHQALLEFNFRVFCPCCFLLS